MMTALIVLLVMGILGVVFGFVLAYANKKFAVEVNPLIHIVEDVLPKGQCGACGYAGCLAYAEAVVMDPDVAPNLCIPGKDGVAKIVAELTGKSAPALEPRIAHIACGGSERHGSKKYKYEGIANCVAASLMHGGPKNCAYGCLGFGNCVKQCPFEALTMEKNGLPSVNKERCTGCGKCESVCPKKVLRMVPINTPVNVYCNSRDKGAVARENCMVACIGCGLCMKACPFGAVKIEDHLAIVDSTCCIEKCNEPVCMLKCPTGAIKIK